MNTDKITTSIIGTGGSVLAFISEKHVAIFAGLATGVWMLWQLGCSICDRCKRKS